MRSKRNFCIDIVLCCVVMGIVAYVVSLIQVRRGVRLAVFRARGAGSGEPKSQARTGWRSAWPPRHSGAGALTAPSLPDLPAEKQEVLSSWTGPTLHFQGLCSLCGTRKPPGAAPFRLGRP